MKRRMLNVDDPYSKRDYAPYPKCAVCRASFDVCFAYPPYLFS